MRVPRTQKPSARSKSSDKSIDEGELESRPVRSKSRQAGNAGPCCMDWSWRLSARFSMLRAVLMPYKFHASHCGKFRKAQYRVTNWPAYNESLRRRGDLTIWVSDDVTQEWTAAPRRTRGGQRKYSDIAIEICLTLRVVFRLALRQTQGFMRSIATLMGLALPVPDFSTLSRRGKDLHVARNGRAASRPITLIVDSTGLKIHSDAAWHGHKHGVKGTRKAWRKLHLALDPDSGVILASELTTELVGDETALPDLFENIDARVDRFVADGAITARVFQIP